MAWKTRIVNALFFIPAFLLACLLLLIGYEGDDQTEENGFYPYYLEGGE